jgi:hypothetical protein
MPKDLLFPLVLGILHSLDRLGPAGLAAEFPPYFLQQFLHPVFLLDDLLDANAIDSRRSSVGFAISERLATLTLRNKAR